MNSPHKNYSSDHQDYFTNKYLSDSSHKPFAVQMDKEHLESQIQALNGVLGTMSAERVKLGDLFNPSLKQIEKTIEAVKMLIKIRQKDVESKNEMLGNLRKNQGERNQLINQIQKLQKENRRLDSEKQSLILKIKGIEKSRRDEVDKLNQERQELTRRCKAVQAREQQYKNEFRKLQSTIKNLQDRINKGQQKVGFKNSFELLQPLQTYGPEVILMNAQNEYNQVVAKTLEQNFNQMARENQYYKDCLKNMQKQLQAVLDVKREVLKRRRGYESDYDAAFQLKNFRSEVLNLPMGHAREGLAQLTDNLVKFREAMKLGHSMDDRDNDQKINCVNGVKNLIKNYKNVIESQDQLLNKVVLKAKEFRRGQMDSRDSMGEQQLQRARRFLQDQSGYLEQKNRELEMTRKAMQSTIKKAEQERLQFVRRSQSANDEVLKMKKQMEMLPNLIQQELTGL